MSTAPEGTCTVSQNVPSGLTVSTEEEQQGGVWGGWVGVGVGVGVGWGRRWDGGWGGGGMVGVGGGGGVMAEHGPLWHFRFNSRPDQLE